MTMLNISQIKRDGAMQPRAELSRDVVAEYAEGMLKGADFPPVDVFHDGKEYWLADGYHRVAAASKTQQRQIKVTVHKGTRRDAILYSVAANSDHGYRRTNEDKRRAVERLLKDQEWAKWSNREIARQCKVSASFVDNLRASICPQKADNSERTVIRGGTTYTQNTANIGQAKQEVTQPAPMTAQESEPETHTVSAGLQEPESPAIASEMRKLRKAAEHLDAAKRLSEEVDSLPPAKPLTSDQRRNIAADVGTVEDRSLFGTVVEVAEELAGLPSPDYVVRRTPPAMYRTTDVSEFRVAAKWLAEFVDRWELRGLENDATK